jgi:hypothetical protein
VPRLPRGDPQALLERNRELEIDAETCEPGDGEPAELADLVDALLSIERRETRAPGDATGSDVAAATSS